MEAKNDAMRIINGLSEIKYSYVMYILQEVSDHSDQEVEDRMNRRRAFDKLTEYIQRLPNPWKDEEELFMEMTEGRRKKRAALT